MLLAVDTSGAVSAAVHDGQNLRASAGVFDPRRHAESLMPLVDEVLRVSGAGRAGITGIAVGIGPGPFTGLRVGLVTAQVLARTWQVPLVGVGSLDALAWSVTHADADGLTQEPLVEVGEEFVVASDARRREVYWARYRRSYAAVGFDRLSDAAVCPAADVPEPVRVFGRGAALYADQWVDGTQVGAEVDGPARLSDPYAADLAQVAVSMNGGSVSGADLVGELVEPLYLRRPDAQVPAVVKKAGT